MWVHGPPTLVLRSAGMPERWPLRRDGDGGGGETVHRPVRTVIWSPLGRTPLG